MVLIRNKSDLRESEEGSITYESGVEHAQNLYGWSKFEIPYVETSAKEGDNVEAAYETLLKNIEQYLASEQ